MPNFILIDGSYFIFYRYYALIQWYKCSKQKPPLDEDNDLINNKIFMDKFVKTFDDKVKEISKKLKIENPVMIVGKDCPRKEIWRNKYYSKYKETRVYDDTFMGGPIFKKVWKDDLFIKGGVEKIFSCPELEADDCIALTTYHILEKYPEANIYIITSDMDYLQLAKPNVYLYNLKYKKLTDSKHCFNDAKKDLTCKIIMGDKSDNIGPIMEKCGIKTASKLYDDPALLLEKFKDEKIKDKFFLNSKIIDFTQIPEDLVKKFKEKNIYINKWD
jgi:5'-3' exonuclease